MGLLHQVQADGQKFPSANNINKIIGFSSKYSKLGRLTGRSIASQIFDPNYYYFWSIWGTVINEPGAYIISIRLYSSWRSQFNMDRKPHPLRQQEQLGIFLFLLCVFISKVGNTTHCMELRFVTVIGNLSKGHGENTKHNFVMAFFPGREPIVMPLGKIQCQRKWS